MGAIACGGHPAPSVEPPISATLHDVIEHEQGLPWSADRRLTWADFQAAAPTTGVEGALTAYNLLYGVRCVGVAFHYDVAAVFLPRQSWVKAVVLADSDERARTLKHEQTHFDLTEVYARRLRKYLHDAYDPCRSGTTPVREGADRLVARESADQDRYDDETRHGLDAAGQRVWDADVAAWLAELAAE